MPYVVKEESTGQYWTTSHAASVDKTDVRYARVYPAEKTARRVAKQFQDREMHWFELENFLIERDGALPSGCDNRYNGVAPNWIVEEI